MAGAEAAGHRVEISIPQRGTRRRLMEQASRNAAEALDRRLAETGTQAKILRELTEFLELPEEPRRIEVYDNSHVQGTNAVGAMIVAGPEGFTKNQYRKFNIRQAQTNDDFGMMREVITRRFARALEEDPDRDGPLWPGIVLLDGGKGQLSAALAAMQRYDLPRVAVIALAKQLEEVFVPGRPDAIVLPEHSAGLQLLQRVRDEAHRFAVTFHRQRRHAASRESMFDQLEGVGPVRRRALLQHFGSAERLLAATAEELEGVPGVPAKTARSIYAQLHRAGAHPHRIRAGHLDAADHRRDRGGDPFARGLARDRGCAQPVQ